MMPHMPGTRVYLEDLQPGDTVDLWSKRSGGYFLTENVTVTQRRDNGDIAMSNGLALHTDANWGEVRRKCTR